MAFDLATLLDRLPWRDRRPRIFISYRRRGDSAGFAARLADRLVDHFGAEQCFRDIEDIESGVDFVDAIDEALNSCEAMIVVIGSDWVTMKDRDGNRRLDDPHDFVRLEVATALRRRVRVIPALVSGAKMPRADALPAELEGLARRQAHELTDSRWDYDVGQLVGSIERLGIPPRRRSGSGVAGLGRRAKLVAGGVAAVLLIAVGTVLGTLATEEPILSGPEGDVGGVEAAGMVDGPRSTGGMADRGSGTSDPPAGGAGSTARTAEASEPGGGTPRTPVEKRAVEPEGRPSTDPSPAEPSAAGPWVDELVEAIREANDEEAYAQENLDPQGLGEHFADLALQAQVASVFQLSAAGETSLNVLHEQRFEDFRVDDGRGLAEVDVREVWSSEHRNALTGQCLHRIAAHPVPQTVYLRRGWDGGWMVYNLVGHDVVVPEPAPC